VIEEHNGIKFELHFKFVPLNK